MDAAILMRPPDRGMARGVTALLRLGLVIAAHVALLMALPASDRPTQQRIEPLVVTLIEPPEPLPASAPMRVPAPLPEPKRTSPPPNAKASKPPPAPVAAHETMPSPAAIGAETVLQTAPASGMPTEPAVSEAALTVAPAPAPKPAPGVVAPRFDAAYLNNPRPEYPRLARRLGEHGKVMLNVYVGASGAAEKVEIRASSGSPRLDRAAREAVTKWQFVPARQGEEPVAAWVLVAITFVLEG